MDILPRALDTFYDVLELHGKMYSYNAIKSIFDCYDCDVSLFKNWHICQYFANANVYLYVLQMRHAKKIMYKIYPYERLEKLFQSDKRV